jgi:hypothetical protein
MHSKISNNTLKFQNNTLEHQNIILEYQNNTIKYQDYINLRHTYLISIIPPPSLQALN